MFIRDKKQGYTLTELLVVIGIVGMLTLISVPSIFRFYKDATDPVKRTARELAQIMQVAKIYAMTYRVNTAVVYGDAFVPVPLTNVETSQGVITGERHIRALVSAAVMYEISKKNNEGFDDIRDRLGFPDSWNRIYVPIEAKSEYGMNRRFEDGIALCNVEFRENVVIPNSPTIEVPLLRSVDEGNSTALLGLTKVNVPFLDLEQSAQAPMAYLSSGAKTSWYAHIFGPDGKLIPTSNTMVKERYILALVDTTNSEPMILPKDLQGQIPADSVWVTHRMNLLSLFRVTGRIKTEI